MKVIKGDLIHLANNFKFDVIIHGCNCFNTMGSGIARQIAEAFPEVYRADQDTIKGDKTKLGTIRVVPMVSAWNYKLLQVVNAYTQYSYGPGKQVDYEAIRSCFREVSKIYKNSEVDEPGYPKIGYPKIGAGLGGGDWSIISKIIDEELEGLDHTLVEYEAR